MKYGYVRSVMMTMTMLVLSMLFAQESFGQTALGKAVRLNVTGGLRHSARGPEVIYRSYGKRATRSDAYASWAASPGHAALVNSGSVPRGRSIGRVCVGR